MTNSQVKLAGAISCSLLLLSACSRQGEGTDRSVVPEGAVARVGGEWILAADVDAELAFRQAAGRSVESAEAVLEDLVLRKSLLLQLEREGFSDRHAVRRDVENLLLNQWQDERMRSEESQGPVEEALVRARYEENLERYTRPAKHRLAILRLEGGKAISEEKRTMLVNRMRVAREKALAVESLGSRQLGFGPLAREASDDGATRHRGGDAGWFAADASTGRWPSEVLEAGRALELGGISPVLEVAGDVYLVMKTDSRPVAITPFEEVHAALTREIIREQERAALLSFHAQALKEAGTERFPANFPSMQPPSPSSVASATVNRFMPGNP